MDRLSDTESSLVEHTPCSACGSSDGNALYDDGHSFCFVCQAYTPGNSDEPRKERRLDDVRFLTGEPQALAKRGLHEDTCRKYGYLVSRDDTGPVQVANYRDQTGSLVGQKVRRPGKDFYVNGKLTGLYGQHLFPDTGRRVVVTEGELDALSVSQVFGNKWPAVSVPNGAQGALKAIRTALEWLSGYEEVVLCFDMDEHGRKAAAECAAVLPPGKAKIAELPLKDANELLQAGKLDELRRAIYDAKLYKPGGIVNGKDIWAKIAEAPTVGTPYPWAGLNKLTYGIHRKTLVTWTAGTGVGKSTVLGEVAYDLMQNHGRTLGYVALEEDVGRSSKRFLSRHLGRLTHLPGATTQEELRGSYDALGQLERLWLLDHFGSTDSEDLIGKLRYLIVGCGCTDVFLDHLSIVVSGMDLTGDERRTIDKTMTNLRSLVEETGCTLHLVSHLKRGEGGKPHEEGGSVSLRDLRGSQSIAQLSDVVIGLERNTQGGDDAARTTIRVLKNRISGDTGEACVLAYDKTTGALTEASPFDGIEETEKDF